ncbi:MAG: molybdopterin-dependent oxidoreductase [Methyloprofundus sp.]|nr:molybdopterin-dependent oxidoreductase [Methyloprofundus sp.]
MNSDSVLHAQGAAQFVDDLPLTAGTLHAFPLVSTIAHADIVTLDFTPARALDGVIDIFTVKDIAGLNQTGNKAVDEVLFADKRVVYKGQPIAIIIAKTAAIARLAASLCLVDYKPLPIVVDAREADRLGLHIAPPRSFTSGDIDNSWSDCDLVVTGSAETGAQEHVYLETQAAIAYPLEDAQLKIISATQAPGMVQRICARILAIPMHKIEVDVLRLGGGFGGKEEQATPWAVMVALAANKLQHPVKITLSRAEDMRFTGKRHPYSADFKIGLDKAGKILSYQVTYYQNAGAFADLSLSILERTLFHAGNAYFIANLQATAISCRTHLPPNTAYRGFGAPQALFILESAIFKAAQVMRVDASVIQRQSLIQSGQAFAYGMLAEHAQAVPSWKQLHKDFAISEQQESIAQFNQEHHLEKKALAIMPICFGIAFTAFFLNQADALVHIYNDGSVSISCGAVEMGQGVKVKLRAIAAQIFAIDPARIKLESTNTTRIANMSPTAASTGADLNGQAIRIACEQIKQTLTQQAALELKVDPALIGFKNETVTIANNASDLNWEALIVLAYMSRRALSAQAHYATPKLNFDPKTEKGNPFAYHVYGCASVEVTVDCLRGIYQVDRVNIVHDVGQSLATEIDLGQIEGALVQGLGWLTTEEIIYDQSGTLRSANLTTYKVPDVYDAPDIQVKFLDKGSNPQGIFNSKAVGEPPFMYATAVYFALLKAMQSFRHEYQAEFSAPMTVEKVLLGLHSE